MRACNGTMGAIKKINDAARVYGRRRNVRWNFNHPFCKIIGMWKCVTSAFAPTKQTSQRLNTPHANFPLEISFDLSFFPSTGKKKLFSFRKERRKASKESREGEEEKKRLDRLLWQEGFRNWRGHGNKRKSIAKDHRVGFESPLWHTVSKCMGTRMESWSVRRSKYLPSLSSLTRRGEGGERLATTFLERRISISTLSFAIDTWMEGNFNFLFFFPSNFETPPILWCFP